MPHPSEAKVNVRLQTRAGTSALDSFKRGLSGIIDVSNHISDVLDAALELGPIPVAEELPPSEIESRKGRTTSRADSTDERMAPTTSRKRVASAASDKMEVESSVVEKKSRSSKR
jgi:hypothetical protein